MNRQSSNVSTHTIVVLLVFLCAAVMTSLFVYHLRAQNNQQSIVSNDVGTYFKNGREIKPFELTTATEKSFTQKNFLNHWTLLFFGFTHCSNVCPTTLALMNKVYIALHKDYPSLQVILISLDPERDTKSELLKYVNTFNPAFVGASGKIEDLRKLQSQFGVYSERSDNNANYQLQHTASIFLINPQGKWAGIFNYGLTPAQFIQGIHDNILFQS